MPEWLEGAIENGVVSEELASRAKVFAKFALSRSFSEDEVEELLTMRSNLNGKRP